MAIYTATQDQKARNTTLTCPFSGRHMTASKPVEVSGHAFGNQADDADWTQSGLLSVIREDAEMEVRDTESVSEESNPGHKLNDSPRASRAGSIGSMRSSSHIGSLTSGIQALIPGGSSRSLCEPSWLQLHVMIFLARKLTD